MQTATNANMLAIGVTWGYRDVNVLLENGAKVIVNSAQEILNLI